MSNASRPRIAAVMIVKDEAHHMVECLGALTALVDAIVVVDTGSRDGTVELARSLGAIVDFFPWNGRFCDARNHALEVAARHGPFDFVLSVDADERVSCTAEDPSTWRDALHVERHVAATVSFIAKEGHHPYDEPRLFALRPDLRWRNGIHETVLQDLYRIQREEDLRVGAVPIRFLHLGYRDDVKARKLSRDLALLMDALEEQPDRLYIYLDLARNLEDLGRLDEALDMRTRGLEIARRELAQTPRGVFALSHDSVQASIFADTLASIQRRFGTLRPEDEALLSEARTHFPDHDLLRLIEVSHLSATGRHEEALARGLALMRQAGDRRGMDRDMFSRKLPAICVLSALAIGDLALARDLETDPIKRERLDGLMRETLTDSNRELRLASEEVSIESLDEATLRLTVGDETLIFGGLSAYVTAALTEPTCPRALITDLAAISGESPARIAERVESVLRRLVFVGAITRDETRPTRPRFVYPAAPTGILCFAVPSALQLALARTRAVLDYARRHRLAPLLWSDAGTSTAARLAPGLITLNTPEAAAWQTVQVPWLLLPATAPEPSLPPQQLSVGDVRVMLEAGPIPSDHVLFGRLIEAGLWVTPKLAASLTCGAQTLDDAVHHAFDPDRRLRWESVGEHLPPRDALRPAPGTVVCIVPYYRCARWLGRALHSVLTQTRPPERVVVACDAGELPPRELIEAFPQVTFVLSPERVGPYALTQAVIDQTDEDWILCQDADDWSSVDRLERQLDHARRTGGRMLGTDLLRVEERTHWCQLVTHPERTTGFALRGGDYALAHPTCLFHRSLIYELGGFATELFVSGDKDFASRAAFVTELHNMPGALVHYLIRETSLTHTFETSPRSSLDRELGKRIAGRVEANHAARRSGADVDLTPLSRRSTPLDLSPISGPHWPPLRR